MAQQTAENKVAIIDEKTIGKINEMNCNFIIESYQRGYRWGKDQVERLLEDIKEAAADEIYHLQPIIVNKKDEKYELIDGQQRLTTLYLIFSYYVKKMKKDDEKPNFTLTYTTRSGSQEFLEDIANKVNDDNRCKANIDFWFMSNAYKTIEAWDKNPDNEIKDIIDKLQKNVKVIWYEANDEDAITFFKGLNGGKIPLTNAELVKALFLSKNSRESGADINTIALQWDAIESELHDDSFWYFLAGKEYKGISTRIDLLLNIYNEIETEPSDPHQSFFKIKEKFDEYKMNNKEPQDIWNEIMNTYQTLKDWYEDNELYHKIGYLIAADEKNLVDLKKDYDTRTTSEFKNILDDSIKTSIYLHKKPIKDTDIDNLLYTKDYDLLLKILLLFSVIFTMDSVEHLRFPFDLYNKEDWSLEHIHPQNVDKHEHMDVWLEEHRASVEAIAKAQSANVGTQGTNKAEDVLNKIDNLDPKNLDKAAFDDIFGKVIELFEEKDQTNDDEDYLHHIGNMALLTKSDNSALNNSIFNVKRKKIFELESNKRSYIPYCTKLVFLKYFTDTQQNSDKLMFWTYADREAYKEKIKKVLEKYL